jgi:hypothetical protein
MSLDRSKVMKAYPLCGFFLSCSGVALVSWTRRIYEKS